MASLLSDTLADALRVDEQSTEAEAGRELNDELNRLQNALGEPSENPISIPGDLLKAELDAVVIVLIAYHGEANGKELLNDFSHCFGLMLSPGTLYPTLHRLEDSGVLHKHEKVRTKEYSIQDSERAQEYVEAVMLQHLAFGLLIEAILSQEWGSPSPSL